MSTPSFAKELSGIPAAIAAELEDHLIECYEACLRAGMSSDEARQSSLRSLGSPDEIAQNCLKASDPRDPSRNPLSLQHRVAIGGWLLMGIGFASRVCEASDPTHASIAACIAMSLGALAMGFLLRRHRIPMRLAIALSLGLTGVAGLACLQVAWHPWIRDTLALTPGALALLAVFGALSGGALTAAPRPVDRTA
jgi:hypothetical protein